MDLAVAEAVVAVAMAIVVVGVGNEAVPAAYLPSDREYMLLEEDGPMHIGIGGLSVLGVAALIEWFA